MSLPPEHDQRLGADRRSKPTSFWDTFHLGGRRMRNRRAEEHRRPYFVDRFPRTTLVLVLLLLLFTIADGVITLGLVDGDCQEINPVMRYLLNKGPGYFLIGKYALTATGLPLLLIFKNYYLFGTPLRVACLIPFFVLLYVLLAVYQIYLLQSLSAI